MSKDFLPIFTADILIVDDAPDNLRLLNQILSKEYKVRLAPGAASGLKAARSIPPDLILLDVMMPEMNGYEVAAQIKATLPTQDIPIIFVSALDDTESKVRAFAAGGVDYITKPFQEREILARVHTHLTLRALYKQAQNEIAERKRVEENLRQRELEYKTLVEHTPDVIARFDRQYRHEYVNPAVEREFGTPPAWLLGKSHRELGQPPEMADWSEGIIRQVFETGQEVAFDLTVPDSGGPKYYLSRGVPELAEDGSVKSVLFIHHNITERKQVEESLLRRNQEMASLYETSLEIHFLSDVDELLLAIVRRACGLLKIPAGVLYLVRPDEKMLELVVGHQLPAHWIGKKICWHEGLAGQVVQTKNPVAVEDYLTWSGRLAAFDDSPARRALGVPLKIHDQVTGVIVLIDKQDGAFSVDEIRLASLLADQAAIAVSNAQLAAELEKRVAQRTAQLEQALKELESLSYTVSHDLRSPLRAIVGYAHIIQNEYAEALPPEVVRLLTLMSNNALVMGAMVDGLLKFMRFSQKVLQIRIVRPAELAQQAFDMLASEYAGRQVEFILSDLPLCQGDEELLLDVWRNLLANALKFSRARAPAVIEVGCVTGEKDTPVYYVKDNGVGFDVRYAEKLFKAFHRLHHVHEFEGIGMGLALTQRILHRHGGRIWVEAEVGKGATFYFTVE